MSEWSVKVPPSFELWWILFSVLALIITTVTLWDIIRHRNTMQHAWVWIVVALFIPLLGIPAWWLVRLSQRR